MLKTKIWVWVFGLLFMQAFALCVMRDFFSPLSEQGRHVVEILLPGFRWHSFSGFLLGLLGSFLWGVYAALVFAPALNVFYLKHHHFGPMHQAGRATV
ncbi:MAG TPA: hypothetical protein VLT16_12025 [Candidatus Limnocylindrales bacterium]|nr:hypothetical protein [Candidatus Limnocylindrales bacterium]